MTIPVTAVLIAAALAYVSHRLAKKEDRNDRRSDSFHRHPGATHVGRLAVHHAPPTAAG